MAGVPASSHGSGGSGTTTTYRKSTSKQVLNTVAETDLLNGEITIAAGVLGTTGVAIIDLWGDWIQNSGGNSSVPLFKLKLGATTLIAWQTSTFNAVNSATRWAWQYRAVIAAANSASAQTCSISGSLACLGAAATFNGDTTLTTGEGVQTAVMGANARGICFVSGYNAGALDMTQAQALVFSTTNATATATYDCTLKGALVVIQ